MQHIELLVALVIRDISARYRGSVLGFLWMLVPALFTLALYFLVFGIALRVQWPQTNSREVLVLILFAGLLVHATFSETLNRAPTLITSHGSYVKKVIFPLALLPVVVATSSMFQFIINLGLLMLISLILPTGAIPGCTLSWLFLPGLIALFWLFLCSIGWLFATIGVYVRDIAQLTPMLTQTLLFAAPILYPAESIPLSWRWLLQLNPLTWFVESLRQIVLWGRSPDLAVSAMWTGVIILMTVASLAIFQKARRGFADVL